MDLKQIYSDLKTAIDQLDEQLDSLGDAKSAGKRKITSDLIDAQKESWEGIVNSFDEQLSSAPAEARIGIFYGIIRNLTARLGDKVNEDLEAIVSTMPEQKPLITPEQAKEVGETRSKVYAQIKSVIALAEQFGEADGMEMPKKRTGSRGKRGKRALSLFTWYIGEKKFDKLNEVVELYPQFEKVADLTKAMRDAGLNLTNPEGDLEFALPDGEVLVGINGATASDDDSDEDGDEEESED